LTREKTKKSGVSGRTIPGLRMKELTEATGLPKSAILHYVAQGLLPEPVRTGPNMAYYDPACIERIKFIKTMQSRYAFPLGKIKMILARKDQGKDTTTLIELSETIFGSADGAPLDKAAFCDATGLSSEQVKALIESGLLLPLQTGRYNEQDVAIGKSYAQGLALGIKVSDMAFYAVAAKRIVDEEMRLRARFTADLPEDQDAGLTQRLVQSARATRNYVIDRTFQRRIAAAGHLKDEKLLS
jgi:predicted DNA-binding transcriptional regulator AlpA